MENLIKLLSSLQPRKISSHKVELSNQTLSYLLSEAYK
jgi:hypothetical protein